MHTMMKRSHRTSLLLLLLFHGHGLWLADAFAASSPIVAAKTALASSSIHSENHQETSGEDIWSSTHSDISSLLQSLSSQRKDDDDNNSKNTVWRPDQQDVERISWGKPAKKKGTGSRGVPHRLNQEERLAFDRARNDKGFLEVFGSAWRSQRRDAPLLNTYRSWCDACAQSSIVLHKSNDGDDAVVVDLSPLRLATHEDMPVIANALLQQHPGGTITCQEDNDALEEDDAWKTRPIYQLPPYCVTWEALPRSDAKQMARSLATFCQTSNSNKKSNANKQRSKKPVGVKPGKGRRHGGYGIG